MYVEDEGFHFCMVSQFRIVKKQFKSSNSTFFKALDLLNTEIIYDKVYSAWLVNPTIQTNAL